MCPILSIMCKLIFQGTDAFKIEASDAKQCYHQSRCLSSRDQGDSIVDNPRRN